MTYDEILEGNELIARFMGYQILYKKYETRYMSSSNESDWVVTEGEIVCDSNGNEVDDINNEPYYDLRSLPFNSSWDWLMPVIDKIENLDVSDLHYKFDVEGEERSNFSHFDFDMECRTNGYSSCVWMELQLDPVQMVAGDFKKIYPTRIESVWNTVVEFIKYYEKTYKPQMFIDKVEHRMFNYYFNVNDEVMLDNDAPMYVLTTDFKTLLSIKFKNKKGIVTKVWSDLHSFPRGSCYSCYVDFDGIIISCLAAWFIPYKNNL